MTAIALCSMLHEPSDRNSATRRFRGEPVLTWTMRRLARARRIERAVVLAWDDQLAGLTGTFASVHACGPRQGSPALEAVAAAQRWAEGWRGGLMQTCPFDNGFVGRFVLDALAHAEADAAVLVDPAAALVDPASLDDLVAAAEGPREMYFTQSPPGLGGVLLKRSLVEKLTAERTLPGRLVHYLPDAPTLDPITSDACVHVPLDVSRATGRYTLCDDRQTHRMDTATRPLNGTLIASAAEAVVKLAARTPLAAEFPRDLVVELTPRRGSRPTFAAGTHLEIMRPDASAGVLNALLDQISEQTDVRVTFAGVGDPLLHADAGRWIEKFAAVAAVSVETDLIELSDAHLGALASGAADVVAVHLPATTAATYARVMNADAMPLALDNVRRLVERRHRLGRGVPVIAPLFTKLADNFDEMEAWYDTWLRAVGSAVIVGPSTFGGRVPDVGVADMTPPVRRPCARLRDRVTVLSDGSVVSCEQDPTGVQSFGNVLTTDLADLWRGPAESLRRTHAAGVGLPVLCQNCSEWHRP